MNTQDFLELMGKAKIYDLTQRLSVHTPPWPSYMPLQVQYFKRIAGAHMGQGANGQIIKTSNHVGTHIDGEIHFYAAGRSIGDTPLDFWYGPGVVADISKEVEDYSLYTPEMIMKKVEVKKGDILIGIPSSGLHTNGYSLARRIVFDRLGLDVIVVDREAATRAGA